MIENPISEMVSVRIRAKNCNGWSEWSDRGVARRRDVGEKEEEDPLEEWMFMHSVEQFGEAVRRMGVSSVEQMLQLTSSDVASGELREK